MSNGVALQSFLTALGTVDPIRLGRMPPSPDVFGVIYEYGGQAVEGRFGVVGVGYERPAFQVVIRGAPNDYPGPMAKALIAWNALADVQPGTIVSGGEVYLTITPQQTPFSLGQDENLRFEIACNYYAVKEPA
mgnify:CR=1 FL=1